MAPIQQMLLGSGGAEDKVYVDDIFSTYLWKGTAANKTINNGINLSADGGMVWVKNRSSTYQTLMMDTEQGTTKSISTNSAGAQQTMSSRVNQFNTNGFRMGSDTSTNGNGDDITSWTFKKTPKFFDFLKYTGNGTARTIAHNLGSIPGLIVIKSLTEGGNWRAYHRGVNNGVNPENYYLRFNGSSEKQNNVAMWQDTAPTSSVFSIQADNNPDEAYYINKNGEEYIAYLFAGGESTAATAVSVDFDGTGDYLASDSSDNVCGTGDFTIEFWFKTDSGNTQRLCDRRTSSKQNAGVLSIHNDHLYWHVDGSNAIAGVGSCYIRKGQWYHAAVVRHSSTTKLYLNGEHVGTLSSDTTDYDSAEIYLGEAYPGQTGYNLDGKMSNFRLVVGTAVYTSSFRPPTEPLTSITNTKLLCCNNSSVTGTTTGTVTSSGDPTASTDSPFDDPAGFAFGDAEENVIKTGSYVGNGSTDGPEINLGWEPQWVLIKRSSDSENWIIFDSMRGIATGANDAVLEPSGTMAEDSSSNYLDLTSTGFKLKINNNSVNANDDTYIYTCIRRSDGYVGKLVEAGTEVFSMDTGGSGTFPEYNSTHIVDMGFLRTTSSGSNVYLATRIAALTELVTNTNVAETSQAKMVFDHMAGYVDYNFGNSTTAWMFKRHAGFDVVTYNGSTASSLDIPHSLNAVPEMIWLKCRSEAEDWRAYHKGLNGGSSPEDYCLKLNTADTEADSSSIWNDTAPTSTHFTVGNDGAVNNNNRTYLAMLFSSVSGISKVGSYVGNGSSADRTITLGFQPRFLIMKPLISNYGWYVVDTTRGWASGDDAYFELNTTSNGMAMFGEPTSTGWIIDGSDTHLNATGNTYVYFAHA